MLHEVGKHTHRCHSTGREIRPGENYYSVLVETAAGPERRDYTLEAWTGPPEGTIGYWKGKLAEAPPPPPKPKEIPLETMVELFDRLDAESGSLDEDMKKRRYMLTLLLVRKRALKLHSIRRDSDQDFLIVRRPSESRTIEVADPGLGEAEIQALETDLQSWMEAASKEQEI